MDLISAASINFVVVMATGDHLVFCELWARLIKLINQHFGVQQMHSFIVSRRAFHIIPHNIFFFFFRWVWNNIRGNKWRQKFQFPLSTHFFLFLLHENSALQLQSDVVLSCTDISRLMHMHSFTGIMARLTNLPLTADSHRNQFSTG